MQHLIHLLEAAGPSPFSLLEFFFNCTQPQGVSHSSLLPMGMIGHSTQAMTLLQQTLGCSSDDDDERRLSSLDLRFTFFKVPSLCLCFALCFFFFFVFSSGFSAS